MSGSGITAICPVTNIEIFPLANAPSDWAGGGKPIVIFCPACERPHEWRPQQGTLIDVSDERGSET